MRYLSVCSGIEAASVAWGPLGWEPGGFAEIEPFPSAVLTYRFPEVRNHGDFTKIGETDTGPVDLLVGGTPCQSFSVAGGRAGLDDPRGVLAFEFLRLAARVRARWLVWENVPGVLSHDDGRTFGAFLGALAELGYGFAHRVLDAQFFGVAQRRERVFVVGYLGDWRPPAAVLFEPSCLSWDPAPSRETREDVAGCVGSGPPGRGWSDDTDRMTFVPELSHSLSSEGADASEDGTGRGVPLVCFGENGHSSYSEGRDSALRHCNGGEAGPGSETLIAWDVDQMARETCRSNPKHGDPSHPIRAKSVPVVASTLTQRVGKGGFTDPVSDNIIAVPMAAPLMQKGAAIGREPENGPQRGEILDDGSTYTVNCTEVHAVAFQDSQTGVREYDTVGSKRAHAPGTQPCGTLLRSLMSVRRLTPMEAERLFGFPDDWTLVPYGKRGKPAKDSPRYRALGNSMAVPVMRWIGGRVTMVEAILEAEAAS